MMNSKCGVVVVIFLLVGALVGLYRLFVESQDHIERLEEEKLKFCLENQSLQKRIDEPKKDEIPEKRIIRQVMGRK